MPGRVRADAARVPVRRGRPMTGLEIELNLVDDRRRPGDAQRRGARGDRRPGLRRPSSASSTSRSTSRRAGWPARRGRAAKSDVRDSLNAAEEQGPQVGRAHGHDRHPADAAAERHDGRTRCRPTRATALLNEQIFAARGEDLHDRRSTGVERLRPTPTRSRPRRPAPASQFHLQVSPDAVRRLLERRAGDRRRAGRASAPTRRSCSARSSGARPASPLFEQATDTRPEEIKAQGVRPRVWFGERWITSIFDLFEENVRYFPALLPDLRRRGSGRGPRRRRRARARRAAPAQRHGLPVEPAGVRRRGRRPAPAGGEPRTAGRARPWSTCSPTRRSTSDWSASLAEAERPLWTQMSFTAAEENFYPGPGTASRRAVLAGLGEVPASELVLRAAAAAGVRGARPLGRGPRRA